MKGNKQKSFFFKDYPETESTFEKIDNNSIKISPNRITFVFFIFSSLILIFSIKIFYLSLFPENNFFSNKIENNFIKERADITDRNGIILARSIDVYSAGVRPKLVKNKKKFLINLKIIFPKIDINKISEKLNDKNFFYIK